MPVPMAPANMAHTVTMDGTLICKAQTHTENAAAARERTKKPK